MSPFFGKDSCRLSDLIRGRDNNFDLIRIVAAVAVIVGHAYELSPSPGEIGPIGFIFGWTNSAHPAVLAFFLFSGILISQSFDRSSPRKFLALRFACLWPGPAAGCAPSGRSFKGPCQDPRPGRRPLVF
jgi:hypothetical protein